MIKTPGWLTKGMVIAYTLLVVDDDIPNTFNEALCSTGTDQWKLAMKEEINFFSSKLDFRTYTVTKG